MSENTQPTTRIFVGTGVTENYLDNAQDYLASINGLQNVVPYCVCLGFGPTEETTSRYSRVRFVTMQIADVQTAVSNFCLQHGDFLDALAPALGITDSDVVIFTDADMVFQRELTEDEIARFVAYGPTSVGVGYNAGPEDTLADEAERLLPRKSMADISQRWPGLDRMIYNTGFVVAKPPVWRRLQSAFAREWPETPEYFGSYAAQQWLLSHIMHELELVIDQLGYEIHTHLHYPIPECVQLTRSGTYHSGRPTLVRHRILYIKPKYLIVGPLTPEFLPICRREYLRRFMVDYGLMKYWVGLKRILGRA